MPTTDDSSQSLVWQCLCLQQMIQASLYPHNVYVYNRQMIQASLYSINVYVYKRYKTHNNLKYKWTVDARSNSCKQQDQEVTLRQTTKKFVTLPSRIRSPSLANNSSVTFGPFNFSKRPLTLTHNKHETHQYPHPQASKHPKEAQNLPHPLRMLSRRRLPPTPHHGQPRPAAGDPEHRRRVHPYVQIQIETGHDHRNGQLAVAPRRQSERERQAQGLVGEGGDSGEGGRGECGRETEEGGVWAGEDGDGIFQAEEVAAPE